MEYQTIRVAEHQQGVRVLSLFRPEKRNAISIQMRKELCTCLESLKNDASVAALVLTGEGGGFCAGFDLREFRQPEKRDELVRTSWEYHRALWHFPKPVVAAVNGAAMGGGFDLAVFCDLRICSESAFFGHPEIKLGGAPLFTPLRWIVGEGLARDLCFTGRTIDAREAHRIGLVSQVVPDAQLLERALQIARQIVEAPAEAVLRTKVFMNAAGGRGFDEAFDVEHAAVFGIKLPDGG
ncbi:MAG: enoyl-CoA hydratase/isomerase family protein [bacterium]